MKTKVQTAKDYIAEGDFIKAIKLCKRFNRIFSQEEIDTLSIADECNSGNDKFYNQIGINTGLKIKEAETIILKIV